jgi:hypothetical protein
LFIIVNYNVSVRWYTAIKSLLLGYAQGSPPSGIGDLCRLLLFCFNHLVFLLAKTFRLFGCQNVWIWAYPMKVIPETRRAHQIWYLLLFSKTNQPNFTSGFSFAAFSYLIVNRDRPINISLEIKEHEFEHHYMFTCVRVKLISHIRCHHNICIVTVSLSTDLCI